MIHFVPRIYSRRRGRAPCLAGQLVGLRVITCHPSAGVSLARRRGDSTAGQSAAQPVPAIHVWRRAALGTGKAASPP
jgi:hypothetical protein